MRGRRLQVAHYVLHAQLVRRHQNPKIKRKNQSTMVGSSNDLWRYVADEGRLKDEQDSAPRSGASSVRLQMLQLECKQVEMRLGTPI